MGDGGALKMEAIVGELFLKASHIILGARTTPAARAPQRKAAKSWFNLEVEEVQSAVRELEPWRRQITVPLVIEVYLQAWGHQEHGEDAASSAQPQAGETMLERWTLNFSPRSQQSGAQQPAIRLDTPAVYKRMVIALRSLYSYVRVLPAYRLFAACRRDGGANCSMRYRIALAASPDVRSGASGRLQASAFAPINTPDGVFQMAVSHQPASAVRVLEKTTAPPALPHIIADYMGDGSAAGGRGVRLPDRDDALPRRSTLSASLYVGAGQKAGAAAVAGSPTPATQSPHAGTAPLLRRHSWSLQGRAASGQLAASPGALPPPTPLSPQYSPRHPQSGTPPTAARTRSTPPRYPSMLSSPRPSTPPHEAAAALPSHVPSLRPRTGSSRLSPVEPGIAGRPLPVSPAHRTLSGGREAHLPPVSPTLQQQPSSSSGSSAARRSSAPVCIPQPGGSTRRLLSSVDLAVLDAQSGSRPEPAVAPSSAPAGGGLAAARSATAAAMAAAGDRRLALPSVTQQGSTPEQRAAPTPFAMPHPLAQPDDAVSSGSATPATPSLPHHTAQYLHSAASSCSTTYQLGTSPQLPFAVTPSSSHSLASLAAAGDGHAQPWGPSPPMSGRHLSALSAVRRQPLWGARSSAGNAQEVRDSVPQTVGYSVSPVADHLLSSTAAARSYVASHDSGGGGDGGTHPPSGMLPMPRVTFDDGLGPLAAPPHAPAASEPYPLDPEESSDMLPFALDESPGAGTSDGLLAGAADSEEALGAFVRMLEQAPPLHAPPRGTTSARFGSSSERLAASGGGGGGGGHASASHHLTLAAGLQQLAALRGALPQQRLQPW